MVGRGGRTRLRSGGGAEVQKASTLGEVKVVRKDPLRGVWKQSSLKHIRSKGIDRSMDRLFGIEKRVNFLRNYPKKWREK